MHFSSTWTQHCLAGMCGTSGSSQRSFPVWKTLFEKHLFEFTLTMLQACRALPVTSVTCIAGKGQAVPPSHLSSSQQEWDDPSSRSVWTAPSRWDFGGWRCAGSGVGLRDPCVSLQPGRLSDCEICLSFGTARSWVGPHCEAAGAWVWSRGLPGGPPPPCLV